MEPSRPVRYDTLSAETAARVVDVLGAHATAQRLGRLRRALASRTREVVVVLEDIANAHNAAAVFRTVEALGFFELHVIEPREGRFKVSSNIASGAHKWLDTRWYRRGAHAYEALRARSFGIWASDVHGDAVDVADIDVSEPLALVFGNEHSGLSPELADAADGRFRVGMCGLVESLNISVAVAMSCYDVRMRRAAAGRAAGLAPEDAQAVLAAWLAKSVGASPEILARAGLPLPVISDVEYAFEVTK